MPPFASGKPRRRFRPAMMLCLGGMTIHGMPSWPRSRPRDGRAGRKHSGYHRRSIAENMMYRLKQLGDRLFSREFDRQVAESHVRAAIINQFTYLGMPKSVRAGQIAPAA